MTKTERKAIVDQAIANEYLEGLEVSPEAKQIMSEYVAGKISAKEAAMQIRAIYGPLSK